MKRKSRTSINSLNRMWSQFVKNGTDKYSDGIRNRGWYFKLMKPKGNLMPIFVWLKGLRGPEAQLWQHEQVTGNGAAKNLIVLSKYKIRDGDKRTLNELIEDFPYAPSASA